MKLISAVFAMLLCASPLMAQTYTWTDDKGTVNFADDLSQVPKKYRGKAKQRSDDPDTVKPEPAATKEIPAAKPAEGKAEPLPKDADKWMYGDRNAGQWRQEFRMREVAYKSQEQKLEEISNLMKNPVGISRERFEALPQEFRETQKEYLRLLKQYNDLNDAANQVGLPAEFRK